MTCDATTQIVRHGQPEAGKPRRVIPEYPGPFVHVPGTGNGQRPAGSQNTPDLTMRAMRLGNRKPEAVKRYLAKHQALASRIYLGVRNA